MGSECFWAVLLAFTVLDTSISTDTWKWLSQHIFTAVSPLLVPGIIAGASVPWSLPALLTEAWQVGACVDVFSGPWSFLLHCGDLCVPLSAPRAFPLHPVVYVLWRGLYALPLSAPQAFPLCCGVSMGFSQSSEPADWSGLHSVSCLRAENCGFLCFLPSKSLLCPVFWDSAASPSACLRGSFYGHGNSSCFRTLSLPWGRSSHPEVSVCSLFMSPSSLLLHCLCPWRSGVFCCHPEVALEKFFHILMSFWCICGEADNLPSYYSAFFCSLLSIVNFRS